MSNRLHYLGPILCEIENADRKRKTAFVFRSGFSDQHHENADRKRKTPFFDLDFSIRKKKLSYLKKSYIFFSDRKIQIEKQTPFFVFDLRFRSRIRSGLSRWDHRLQRRKNSSWHLNGFPANIIISRRIPPLCCTLTIIAMQGH